MSGPLAEEIEAIAAAVEFQPPASFSFAGRLTGPVGPLPDHVSGMRPSSNPMVDHLAGSLYNYCYTRRFQGVLGDEMPTGPGGDLTASLSAANASRERWDTEWQVAEVFPTGQVLARKGTLDRRFWPGDYITQDAPGMPPRVGARLRVFLRRESATMQPGFYFAFGETAIDPLDDDNLVRFYWNVNADGAPALTRLVTGALNRFQVPFRFKCLTERAHFYRLDSAVLFVNKRHHRIAAELLLGVHEAARPELGPDVPLFTKRIAAGLALAEDPGSGESFGMNRCRLLAEGLWVAHGLGLASPRARADAAVAHLAGQGVSPDRPYATGGFAEQYDHPQFPD